MISFIFQISITHIQLIEFSNKSIHIESTLWKDVVNAELFLLHIPQFFTGEPTSSEERMKRFF